jgi:hypothetical protein
MDAIAPTPQALTLWKGKDGTSDPLAAITTWALMLGCSICIRTPSPMTTVVMHYY